jgi:hypothetical protein
MLPPFIIEQIRRREERERARPQPQLEVPRERTEPSKPGKPAPAEDQGQRGVVVIDLMSDEG